MVDALQREMVMSSMVTSTPNALVREYHLDRMPVILDPDDYAHWLTGTPDEAFALLKAVPAERRVINQSGKGLKSDHGGLD
ncbi:SOS response-associated peptidase family protein [Loktanella atrilutea]|nr:SOS response-associated peptidase family protein [Loktanella atrilutea]